MAEETQTALEILMRLITKTPMLLLAPIPGVALKTYLEYRINKKIKLVDAITGGVIAILLGWLVGYFTFVFFYDTKDPESIYKALNFSILTAVTTALLGEKVGLYMYENTPIILDAVVRKFTGTTIRRKPPTPRRKK
jgi:hypothetical protein